MSKEQVICVDDKPRAEVIKFYGKPWAGDPVVKGVIYTIRGIDDEPHHQDGLGYLLEEVSTQHYYDSGDEVGYLASRFRPIEGPFMKTLRKAARKGFQKDKVGV